MPILNHTCEKEGKFDFKMSDEDENSWIGFWCSVALFTIAGLISIFGNGLVLYATNLRKDEGKFEHINLVVKHLALSDFLFGLIGTPFSILFLYMGKTQWFTSGAFFYLI